MSDADKMTVYSDYVCPFCYLGRRSLDTFQAEYDHEIDIDWHPYDLRGHKRRPDGTIDHEIEDGKDEAYYEQVRQNVNRLREQYDAEEMLEFDAIPDRVDSLNAQLASFYVKREHPATWLAFDTALFEALWVDGRDIGDVDVLVDLAERTGIEGSAIRSAIEDDALRTAVEEAFINAQQKRITGVPTFVYDKHIARGAVPPAQLRRLVEGH